MAVRNMLLANQMPLKARIAADRPWPFHRSICPFCDVQEPETVGHYVSRCSFYRDLRDSFVQRVSQIYPRMLQLRRMIPVHNDEELVLRLCLDDRAFLEVDDELKPEIGACVLDYLKLIDKRRTRVWSRMTEKRHPWTLKPEFLG